MSSRGIWPGRAPGEDGELRADWSYRLGAFLVDFALALAIGLLVDALIEASGGNVDTADEVAGFTVIAVWLLLTSGVSAVTRGQSLGRLIAGTRAVRDGGRSVGFWWSILRDTVSRLLWLIPPFLVVDSLWPLRPQKESFRDRITSTHVVKTEAYPRRGRVIAAAAAIAVSAFVGAATAADDLGTYSRDEWLADCQSKEASASYCGCVYDRLNERLDDTRINELASGVDSDEVSAQTDQALKGAMDECS